MIGAIPPWIKPPELNEALPLVELAIRFGRIAVIQGPASSGKRELCRALFQEMKAKNSTMTFSEISCGAPELDKSCQKLEGYLTVQGALGAQDLLPAESEGRTHVVALYDASLLHQKGFLWLINLAARSRGVGFIVTSHMEILRILPGGLCPPDAFQNPLVLQDWTTADAKRNWKKWVHPWSNLAARAENGDKNARASAAAIIKATGGRLGQLAAFAAYWNPAVLKIHGFDSTHYETFSLGAVKTIGNLLFSLRTVKKAKRKKHPNQTGHHHLPSARAVVVAEEE